MKTNEQLQRRYKDLMDNQAISNISNWHKTIFQDDHSKQITEEEYLKRAKQNIKPFMDKMQSVIEKIKNDNPST